MGGLYDGTIWLLDFYFVDAGLHFCEWQRPANIMIFTSLISTIFFLSFFLSFDLATMPR